jgi:hypothetical protein
MRSLHAPAAVLLVATVATVTTAQAPAPSWLDKPLTGWNVPASSLPAAPKVDTAARSNFARCQISERRGTGAERAVADAGWMPFLVFDRELVSGDIEIVGGMASADGMCRPLAFNVFVFVGGRFAGTLSPGPMDSRTDGVVGAVRILDTNTMSAEFSRYLAQDALCCPSLRVSVRYRVERGAKGPVVAAAEIRAIR